MSRPNPAILCAFLVAVWAVLGGIALAKGGFFLAKHEGDTFHLLQIVFRMTGGEWPHLDFMTPIGIMAFAPIALFVEMGAGVGKATIYRRWPSKLPLVVEAFGRLPSFEDVDTGSLEGDLKTMLRRYLEAFLATPLATVYPSLAAERAHNPDLSELLDPILRSRRQPLSQAFERARARGELRPGADLDMAADLVVGPIAVRLFFRGMKIHPDMVDPMVDLALRGLTVPREDER